MMESRNISLELSTPSIEAVIKAQGIPDLSRADERTITLAESALTIFNDLAEPVGILSQISNDDFGQVFIGEGLNKNDAPLDQIYTNSDKLALFAVTLGPRICDEISTLFKRNDFALGSMLDSAASEGAELTAEALEHIFRLQSFNSNDKKKSHGTMRFSPGYCGWHVSAQKRLFGYLKPEQIGIELNSSCLMEPLKSVSGVIVLGVKEIFQFDDMFDFCAECTDHSCQDRIKALMKTV